MMPRKFLRMIARILEPELDRSSKRLQISRDFAAHDVGDFHEREREREREGRCHSRADSRGEVIRCGSLGVP